MLTIADRTLSSRLFLGTGGFPSLDLPPDARGVAVAVDAEVVPRGEWARHALADGADVEVLHAIQGG